MRVSVLVADIIAVSELVAETFLFHIFLAVFVFLIANAEVVAASIRVVIYIQFPFFTYKNHNVRISVPAVGIQATYILRAGMLAIYIPIIRAFYLIYS